MYYVYISEALAGRYLFIIGNEILTSSSSTRTGGITTRGTLCCKVDIYGLYLKQTIAL